MFPYVVLEHYARRSRVRSILRFRGGCGGLVYMHALFLLEVQNLERHAQQEEADRESVCGYPRG